jgi:SAM-dependent methyltransferase
VGGHGLSSFDERNPVLEGGIDYGRVFFTFTEHTDQKLIHGLIFQALLQALKERGVLLRDGQPTVLVDLGCGDGTTAREMIDAINRVHPRGSGIDYYGLDADERFVLGTARLLNEVRRSKHLRVIDVRRADVLAGEPLPIPPMDHVLATMGHVLYYAHSREGKDQTRTRIAAIVDGVTALLGRDGLCVFVHNADDCSLATLRASVTPPVEAKPAGILADIAEAKQLVVVSFTAPFKVHLPRLASEQWDETKEPSSYGAPRNSHDPRFVETLEVLTFIAQRDLRGLAAQGVLGAFVDELRAQIDPAGAFDGVCNYQLMLPRMRSPGLREHVEAAVRQVEQSLDRIGRESEEAFNRTAQKTE